LLHATLATSPFIFLDQPLYFQVSSRSHVMVFYGRSNVEFKVITKVFFEANFERFTKSLNHEILELYTV